MFGSRHLAMAVGLGAIVAAICLPLGTQAAPQGGAPVEVGDTVNFTHSTVGCPTEDGLKALESDAAAHDRDGFNDDMLTDGCIEIPYHLSGLVIRSDGILDPWYKIRIYPSKRTFWIDDLLIDKNNSPIYILSGISVKRINKAPIDKLPKTIKAYYPNLLEPLRLDEGSPYCRNRKSAVFYFKYGPSNKTDGCDQVKKDTPIFAIGYSGNSPNLTGFTFRKGGKQIEYWTKTAWIDNQKDDLTSPTAKCWQKIIGAGHLLPCGQPPR